MVISDSKSEIYNVWCEKAVAEILSRNVIESKGILFICHLIFLSWQKEIVLFIMDFKLIYAKLELNF